MTNPFDDESGTFLVLVNDEGQHSLWPDALPVPPGWMTVGPHATRQECLDWIDAHWTDIRPKSLLAALQRGGVS